MRKQLISFAQVLKFSQNIKLKGGGLTPTSPLLAYALDSNQQCLWLHSNE